MRSTLEIEGTWEEILANANEFSGKRVKLILLEKDLSQESDLFQEINFGVSPDTWEEYHTLIAKRQAEILTEKEQQQLIEISDQLEAVNVRRIKALIELSNLRGQSLDSLMLELGIPASS
jgi:ABC-type uncharacterized transport system ATPase subunit